jgi:hypothetical protein
MEFPDDVVGGKAKQDVCWHRCCWLSWALLLLAVPTTIVAPRVAKGNGGLGRRWKECWRHMEEKEKKEMVLGFWGILPLYPPLWCYDHRVYFNVKYHFTLLFMSF